MELSSFLGKGLPQFVEPDRYYCFDKVGKAGKTVRLVDIRLVLSLAED